MKSKDSPGPRHRDPRPKISRPSRITFGVELEFLTEELDGDEGYDGTRKFLAKAIKHYTDLPIAVSCCHRMGECHCGVCITSRPEDRAGDMAIVTRSTSEPRELYLQRYRYFLIKPEDIAGGRHEWDEYRGIKITSPVSSMDELRRGLPELDRLLSSLRRMRTDIRVSESCGLHVHTGIAEGVYLPVTKRLVTLVMMLEKPLLRLLVPPARRRLQCAGSIVHGSGFGLAARSPGPRTPAHAWVGNTGPMAENLPWGNQGPPRAYWNDYSPLLLLDALRYVWNAPTLAQLARGINRRDQSLVLERLGFALCLRDQTGEPFMYGSFSGLPVNSGSHTTFEFRYPQMEFELDLVRFWVELCCRMTEIAALGAPQFRALLGRLVVAVGDGEMDATRRRGMVALLNEMSLGHWAQYMVRKLDSYE